MSLSRVEKDLGADAAHSVAHKLVMHQRRSGGQTQHSEMLELSPKSERVQDALNYTRKNLSRSLSVEELAEADDPADRGFGLVKLSGLAGVGAEALHDLRRQSEIRNVGRNVGKKENGPPGPVFACCLAEHGGRLSRRGRIESILDWGTIRQLRRRDSPARWAI